MMTELEIKDKKETLKYLLEEAEHYRKEHPDSSCSYYRHLCDEIDDIAGELQMEGVDLDE